MKKILLVSILLISSILITTPIGYAGEPGPGAGPGERLVGPTIDAIIGIRPTSIPNGCSDVVLSGICNGQPFAISKPCILPGDLTTTLGDYLVGQRIPLTDIPTICNPKLGQELMIVGVKNFVNTGYNDPGAGQAIADVVLMFVESK